jgi:type IV pilus assembly protein PilA
VAASWATHQLFPADNVGAGLPPAEKIVGNFVSSISLEAGAIHITFGNRANNAIGLAPVPGNMTVRTANKTDIPPRYLPFRCRAD